MSCSLCNLPRAPQIFSCHGNIEAASAIRATAVARRMRWPRCRPFDASPSCAEPLGGARRVLEEQERVCAERSVVSGAHGAGHPLPRPLRAIREVQVIGMIRDFVFFTISDPQTNIESPTQHQTNQQQHPHKKERVACPANPAHLERTKMRTGSFSCVCPQTLATTHHHQPNPCECVCV